MEAISVPPSRRRSPAAVEIAAATGLGPLLLGALLVAGAFAYAAVAAIAIAAASSSRDAPSLIAIGIAAVSLLIAFYGLGGKIVPELHLAGLSLDPGSEFSRL